MISLRQCVVALGLLACLPSAISAHVLQYYRWLDVNRGVRISSSSLLLSYDCRFIDSAFTKPDPVLDTNNDGAAQPDEKVKFLTQACDYITSDLYLIRNSKPMAVELASFKVSEDKNRFQAEYQSALPLGREMGSTETLNIIDPAFLLGQMNPAEPLKPTVVVATSGVAILDDGGALKSLVQRLETQSAANTVIRFAREAVSGVTSAPTVVAAETTSPATGGTEASRLRRLVDAANSTSPAIIVISLLVAALLGAAHALTPVHGKTIVAAYLIGSKGRIRDAIYLGLIVTFTHTFSVIVLGIIALVGSRYIVQEKLYSTLGLISGVLVFLFGLLLLVQRLKYSGMHFHGFSLHSHSEPLLTSGHSHGEVTPAPSGTQRLTWKGLVALGVSGGIVPCPDAVVVLLVAIALNRAALGLAIIGSFSVGLAAVLIIIGILMVASRPLLDKFSGGVGSAFAQIYLPVGSAALVMILGLGIVGKVLMDMGLISVNWSP